jgi:hypothetical protein
MSAGKSARNAAQLCSPRGPWLHGIQTGYLCFPSDAAALIETEQMLSHWRAAAVFPLTEKLTTAH